VSELAGYIKTGAIAKIVMDDGKVNVMSAAMLGALLGAFDRADKDRAIVVLTSGREGIFSAGFDTKIIGSKDPQQIYDMVRLGAELAARILSFRCPVVIACNGHAFPSGVARHHQGAFAQSGCRLGARRHRGRDHAGGLSAALKHAPTRISPPKTRQSLRSRVADAPAE
jgi:Enoyl-CoA hydratase/isomerase